MNGRLVAAAVLVLLVVVGGTFLLIGLLQGDDSTDGSNPDQQGSPVLALDAVVGPVGR